VIETVWFKNLRALQNVEVPLSPLTLLIGANGSGKSTVLDGLHGLSQVVANRTHADPIGEVFRGRWDPRRIRTNGQDGRIEIGAVLDGDPQAKFAVRLDATEQPQHSATLVVSGNNGLAQSQAEIKQFLASGTVVPLGSCVRLRLEAEAIGRESYSADERPRLAYDGSGLPSVIAWLAGNEPDHLAAILEGFKRVIPRALRFRTPRKSITIREPMSVLVDGQPLEGTRERKVPADRLEVELRGAGWVPADLLSEGTLLALALVTALNMPDRPRLVLLDDIDRGLHPTAQRSIVDLIREAARGTQVLATTHSPFVLDCVEHESVRVLQVSEPGEVACKRLTEHPEWSRWSETMGAGEFWTWAGDEWVFGAA
jgi:energy-coupling factor transporter ATP-binding protein EcfA2